MINAAQKTSARQMQKTITRIVEEHCGCIGYVSLRCCEDVVVHYERDIVRLLRIHPNGVHPTKCVGYQAFWIRKLKPVTIAVPVDSLAVADPEDDIMELVTINEIVAIYAALHLALSYAHDGHLTYSESVSRTPHSIVANSSEEKKRQEFVGILQALISGYIENRVDAGDEDGNIFASILYDTRYRTFGPHHFVHFINHLVYAARYQFNGAINGKTTA